MRVGIAAGTRCAVREPFTTSTLVVVASTVLVWV
jgi:hypothetical protein